MVVFLGVGRVERSLSWRKSWHITVPQGATGGGVGVGMDSPGLEAEGVFVGMGEGDGCVAAGGGFSVTVGDGSIGVGLGVGVGGSGEGTKVETAALRVDPSRAGVGEEGRWAALMCKGSRGKRSQAAREPSRRAVEIISTPTLLSNQPLFDLIFSPRKDVEQCSCPTPIDRCLLISLGHVCQGVVGWSQGSIRANDAKFGLSICEIREPVVQVP